MIKVGSDFSGVGSFNQALKRLGIEYEEIFACDMDKYARETFIHNYGEPKYYPKNVYDREIPSESLDIYMTSPPCQAFSLAGKRMGKEDKRGILFFNSHEFIKKNKPRYFIFENVKGLLSDDNGKTFNEWVNLLGGKSINGNSVLFPYQDSVPYHIYWKVLNAKDYGVPQNRERVFIIGIRDDIDNNFTFPAEENLTKRLKDVLEDEVDKKYFLSQKRDRAIGWTDAEKKDTANCDGEYLKINSETPNIIIHEIPEIVKVRKHEIDIPKFQQLLKVHKNKTIKKIAEELKENHTTVEHWFRTDKFFSIPDAEIWHKLKICLNIKTDEFDLSITEFEEKEGIFEKSNRVYDENGIAPTMTSTSADERILTHNQGVIHNCITEAIGRQGSSKEYIDSCKKVAQALEEKYNDKRLTQTVNTNKFTNGIPSAIDSYNQSVSEKVAPTVKLPHNDRFLWDGFKIRRLTPRECFRLMDFPDTFTWNVSDSQAYKQAGNSIVVGVLYKIIKKLNL